MMMAIAFYYIGAIYLFQSIYHYFVPVPMLLAAIEEEKAEKEKAEHKEEVEEQQPEETNKKESD